MSPARNTDYSVVEHPPRLRLGCSFTRSKPILQAHIDDASDLSVCGQKRKAQSGEDVVVHNEDYMMASFQPAVVVRMQERLVIGLWDTAASVSLCNEEIAKELGLPVTYHRVSGVFATNGTTGQRYR